MLQRITGGGGLTLLHGDPNPTNVLTGLTPLQPLYLIDRQPFPWTCRQGLGAADLIHAATPYWPPDVRRALEAPLLESYRATLLEAARLNRQISNKCASRWLGLPPQEDCFRTAST